MGCISTFFSWKWCSASIVSSVLLSYCCTDGICGTSALVWSFDEEKADVYIPLIVFE